LILIKRRKRNKQKSIFFKRRFSFVVVCHFMSGVFLSFSLPFALLVLFLMLCLWHFVSRRFALNSVKDMGKKAGVHGDDRMGQASKFVCLHSLLIKIVTDCLLLLLLSLCLLFFLSSIGSYQSWWLLFFFFFSL